MANLPKVLKLNRKLTPIYIDFGKKIGGEIEILYKKLRNSTKNFSAQEIEKEFKTTMEKILWKHGIVSFPFERHTGHAICVSKNEVVAHGFCEEEFNPSKDVVSLDFGVKLSHKNLNLSYIDINFDFAFTVGPHDWVLEPQKTLQKIVLIQPKNTREISQIIESVPMKKVVQLTGHGIGEELHQAPPIHNMLGKFSSVPLVNDMAFCPEPIYTEKTDSDEEIEHIYMEDNDIKTLSGQPSTHWETVMLVHDNKLIDVIGVTNWQ